MDMSINKKRLISQLKPFEKSFFLICLHSKSSIFHIDMNYFSMMCAPIVGGSTPIMKHNWRKWNNNILISLVVMGIGTSFLSSHGWCHFWNTFWCQFVMLMFKIKFKVALIHKWPPNYLSLTTQSPCQSQCLYVPFQYFFVITLLQNVGAIH
jgi:hypothetical protein